MYGIACVQCMFVKGLYEGGGEGGMSHCVYLSICPAVIPAVLKDATPLHVAAAAQSVTGVA